MRFEFFAYRFLFEARTPIHIPPGHAGNLIRGAFGTIFRRHACEPGCTDAKTCEHRDSCTYARIFEPAAVDLPSGLGDPPRPFVFRAGHLDGRTLYAGDQFHFDTHIFYREEPGLIYFVTAFAELANEGIGPGRGQADLIAVDQLNLSRASAARVYSNGRFLTTHVVGSNSLSLNAQEEEDEVTRLRVRFVTPTELKSGGEVIRRPEFGILFARIRDRISTLRTLYGPGPLTLDFRSIAERAAVIRMARYDLNWVTVERRSSRTGQTHGVGGFTGEVDYHGNLGEFLPYLRAAYWTGVGRHTVWGNGQVESD